MNSWHSYASILNIGHAALAELFSVPVNVEEKIDGSQFSFGVDEEGVLHVRSKGAKLIPDAPGRMFQRAVDSARELAPLLRPGWTYRGEYLAKPKHNTLAYDRVPDRHIIIFDVNDGQESYLPYAEKLAEAARIGLECVPLLASGVISTPNELRAVLDTVSVLGGQKIEGVVVKPQAYGLFGADKKALMGKFVSEAFKEIHGNEWRKEDPTTGDIVEQIATDLKSPARWNKALQHLKEAGRIKGSPRDIGPLIKEVPEDVLRDAAQEIKERLFAYAWPQIRRRIVYGLPEWYKDKLMTEQFEEISEASDPASAEKTDS